MIKCIVQYTAQPYPQAPPSFKMSHAGRNLGTRLIKYSTPHTCICSNKNNSPSISMSTHAMHLAITYWIGDDIHQ